MNVVPAIKAIEAEIGSIKAKHRMELEPYETSLRELRKINTACEMCAGKGKVFKRSCAEDEGDYYECSACNGSGVKKK
jgi:hypothetical protein